MNPIQPEIQTFSVNSLNPERFLESLILVQRPINAHLVPAIGLPDLHRIRQITVKPVVQIH